MLQDPSAPAALAWLSILCFGFASIIMLMRLFDRDDQIRADAQGLYWKRWSPDVIPWNEIADVSEAGVQRQRILCLHLRHPERYPSHTLLGRLASANKVMGFGDIAINAMGTDRSFDELKAAVLGHWERRPTY